ncbi:MAG: Dam family site-specific DNA-(adenine-N6)-methyltransferase [Candidatus Altiarchaeales archaeon]|nr:Dam family site-specific DNA-(adenine-N6)-methyltransferase [Candidatus Altiarchaeales archaeon]
MTKPFLKWVGGKQQLLNQYDQLFPKTFDSYFEPFIGGGAVFFHLQQKGITGNIRLSDSNEELINAYRVVRGHIDELIAMLKFHQENHSKGYYYRIRELDRLPIKLNHIERAARTLYLNKTCYNGLYRVNSKGQFNSPMGSYKNPNIANESVLRQASEALQDAFLMSGDFSGVLNWAMRGDFVYFDPPYDPISDTANYTGYTANGFDDKDQFRLWVLFRDLTNRGCYCMLSNADTELVRDTYKHFRIETVQARRAVNSKAGKRGPINEVVILNYDN